MTKDTENGEEVTSSSISNEKRTHPSERERKTRRENTADGERDER